MNLQSVLIKQFVSCFQHMLTHTRPIGISIHHWLYLRTGQANRPPFKHHHLSSYIGFGLDQLDLGLLLSFYGIVGKKLRETS
jgi:hypothetical protein